MELNQILSNYFCQHYMIDINNNYKIKEIDAKELIVPERIDLIAKIKYIECREKNYKSIYIKELYRAHIEAFSEGTYIEPGNDSKNSINKYFKVFNDLIDHIKEYGMDNQISVIPVGKNNVILDGAHRVAIAAYFNLKVPIIRFENLYVDYGVEFFQNRLLSQKHINYLVTEYCRFKDNLLFICSWPESMENLSMNNNYKVLYTTEITINYKQLNKLIAQIDTNTVYVEESNKKVKVNLYLLECNSLNTVTELKEHICSTYSSYFTYITNNQKETIDLANLLLNNNSLNLLQRVRLLNFFKRKIRNLKIKLIKIAKKIGLYKELRIFYRYVREIVK